VPGKAEIPDSVVAKDVLLWLDDQSTRFLATVESLWASDFNAESTLRGVTTGYVITHVARCADGYADEIYERRTGDVFPVDSDRRFPEASGSLRPGAVLIEDVVVAMERVAHELRTVANTDFGSQTDIGRIPAEFLVEVVLHHADLGSPLVNLSVELLQAVLAVAVVRTSVLPAWPIVALHDRAGFSLVVGESPQRATIRGAVADLLAWLTGRPLSDSLETPDGVIPELPKWDCYRPLEPALASG
jgi:maleylpyruvate isomerase